MVSAAISTVMTSGDMSNVPLLPCGFFMVPASGSNNRSTSFCKGFINDTDAPSSNIVHSLQQQLQCDSGIPSDTNQPDLIPAGLRLNTQGMNVREEMVGSNISKEEDMENRSIGSGNMDAGSGEEQDERDQLRRKRYHRHTARQIQHMEALFKEFPHPDEKQRLKLSQELGLKPRQVKFWFQNRRTQMKAQQDRADNMLLRAENESLKSENFRLQAAIRNINCANCGSPGMFGELSFDEQHLRVENARLREELDRICGIASRYNGRPLQMFGSSVQPQVQPSLDLDMGVYARHFQESMASSMEMIPPVPVHRNPMIGLLESEKPMALNLAIAAMEQLLRMAQGGEPLWVKEREGEREMLNLEEHARICPWPGSFQQRSPVNFRMEASRDTTLIMMNTISLVSAFMDADKWVQMFPAVVARARTIQVIIPGIGNHSLQLMHAEFQFPTPLVPSRECYFLRFCSQQSGGDSQALWGIVDFPLDGFDEPYMVQLPTVSRCRRRPSGLIIQDVHNGYSKVTWVENTEAEDRAHHQIFSQFLLAGNAFCAQRWIANLQRHFERAACVMTSNTIECNIGEARSSIMHLAARMVRLFNTGVSSAGGQSWTAISSSEDDTIRITTRRCTEPGHPHGVILSGVSSSWLPYSHLQVFDFLRCEKNRSQLDALCGGSTFQEAAHIATGSHPGNYVALLRIKTKSKLGGSTAELMLQESFTDASGSMVVYAPIDVAGINVAMNSRDTSSIPLLPCGFIIVPAAESNSGDSRGTGEVQSSKPSGHGGCILTAAFQVLGSAIPTSKISTSTITAVNNHICNAVREIHAAISSSFSSEPALSSVSS